MNLENKSKIFENSKKIGENLVNNVVPFTKEKIEDVKEFANNRAMPTIKESALSTKDTLIDVSNKAVETVKSNLTEEQVIEILNSIYIKSVNGINKVSVPVDDLVSDYLKKNNNIEDAAKALIKNSMVKCGTSGFLTGLGGFATMFATLPANLTSVIYVQLRMCCAIAKMAGYDILSDQVQTLIYACLTESAMADILKQAGIKFGHKFGIAMVKKIPGTVMRAINHRVGFRFITKFGEKGIVNLHKVVPVLGGAIGGAVDVASTKTIGYNGYNLFIKEEISDNVHIEEVEDIKELNVEDDIDTKMLNDAIKISNSINE